MHEMNEPDGLEPLWKGQAVDEAVTGREMREIVLKKITDFDRMIRVRNMMESVAALVVAAFFAYAAWRQSNWIEQLGSVIIAGGALWIIYYLRRHGTSIEPPPDQTLASYRRGLVLKYEHQIRLLRNVKFWYLLPLYVGLLIATLGKLREQAANRDLIWADAVPPLVYTVFFVMVWWLNEGLAVGKLRRLRAKLISSANEEAL
jgi:hypothetical protein